MRWEGNRILVDFHEWAWSRRSEGFGVYAIKSDGTVEKIGVTVKRPVTYQLPAGTIAVMRYYESNKGYVSLYIYTKDGKQFSVHEVENFGIPEELDDKVRMALARWLER